MEDSSRIINEAVPKTCLAVITHAATENHISSVATAIADKCSAELSKQVLHSTLSTISQSGPAIAGGNDFTMQFCNSQTADSVTENHACSVVTIAANHLAIGDSTDELGLHKTCLTKKTNSATEEHVPPVVTETTDKLAVLTKEAFKKISQPWNVAAQSIVFVNLQGIITGKGTASRPQDGKVVEKAFYNL
jgi:hypothetical protein